MAYHFLNAKMFINTETDQLHKHSFIDDNQILKVLDGNAWGTQPYCRYKCYGKISALSGKNLLLKTHDMARIFKMHSPQL